MAPRRRAMAPPETAGEARAATSRDLLRALIETPGPSGDESAVAALVVTWARQVPGVRLWQLGDSVLALKGAPRVAVFAHLDTTGFTLGPEKRLFRIGGPAPVDRTRVKCRLPSGETLRGRVRVQEEPREFRLTKAKKAPLGSRWVYDTPVEFEDGWVHAPYLDNRAGVWNALRVLARAPDVAVAFTAGEEHGGWGARACARVLSEQHGLSVALISDITWDTEHVKCGEGVALSLRDQTLPRQRLVEYVLVLAERSGVRWQREVESSGGSDGAGVDGSGTGMDWIFIGAPEKEAHSPRESLLLSDLGAMTDLCVYLAANLDPAASGSGLRAL
jgi:putative aminopeptidase FrvX